MSTMERATARHILLLAGWLLLKFMIFESFFGREEIFESFINKKEFHLRNVKDLHVGHMTHIKSSEARLAFIAEFGWEFLM